MNSNNALDQAAINRRAITEEGIPLIALSPSYNQKGEVYCYEIGSPLYDVDGEIRAYEWISGKIVPADTALVRALKALQGAL